MLIDSHNHLQDKRLESIEGEMSSLSMVNGTCEGDWERVSDLATKFPDKVIPNFGLHPWFLDERSDDWEMNLRDRLDQFPNAGIGEVGIDKWVRGHDMEVQEPVFETQISVAAELQIPLSIHCLQAFGRLRDVLERNDLPQNGFLLHSYSGPVELVDDFLELGGYFSISGYFMQDRKADAREVFREIPIDRLLVETDAPDMPLPEELNPNPLPESVNHPANIAAIYQFAAELRNVEVGKFEKQMEENFSRFAASIWPK